MNVFSGKIPVFDFEQMASYSDEHLRILFDYCADHVDNAIQNALIAELMTRYADVSKQLEEKNQMLKRYNEDLEELVREKVKEISASQIATIHALVKSAESRDDDTGAHIERTSAYCALIAKKLYEKAMYPDIIDAAFIENIAMASPLHDIGKVGIKDAVLLKPGRLTDEEFEYMKTHVDKGYETIVSIENKYPQNKFIKIGSEIARYHHEKWDGGGYMNKLSGEDIPLSARIMALSDVYDALRSKRVYKDAFSHEKTLAIITDGRGNHFDPALVDIFLENHLLFGEVFDRLSG
jgi:putative two-component system response regulator